MYYICGHANMRILFVYLLISFDLFESLFLQIIKGEIRNLFQLHPEVKVRPRIFGQLGERKVSMDMLD